MKRSEAEAIINQFLEEKGDEVTGRTLITLMLEEIGMQPPPKPKYSALSAQSPNGFEEEGEGADAAAC
jgi:hypothetical protein